MKNFEYKNPTKIIFGKGQIEKLSEEVPENAKILMLYGGGSIKRNGIYEQVVKALDGFEVLEFGGIPANPEYSILMKALKVIKEENITFLLAVGGGSVIDGTKFLSSAALYDGENPWDILTEKIATQEGMPFGTVLTIPATGSEMNSGAVITREETKEKLSMGGPGIIPSIFHSRSPGDTFAPLTTTGQWYHRCFYACSGAVHDLPQRRMVAGQVCRKHTSNPY